MKTSTLLVVAAAAVCIGCNGSLYRPSTVPRLSRNTFLAFGDSITFGVSASCKTTTTTGTVSQIMAALAAEPAQPWSYPNVLETELRDRYVGQRPTVANRGFGGELLSDGLLRIGGVLTEEQPQVMLLLEGANDVNQNHTPADIANGLAQLIRAARARGVQSYVSTLTPQRPIGTAGSCRGFNPSGVAPANNQIRLMAASEGAVLVDVYNAFGGQPGTLIGEDGLHPTEAGYARIADTFFAEIRKRLEE